MNNSVKDRDVRAEVEKASAPYKKDLQRIVRYLRALAKTCNSGLTEECPTCHRLHTKNPEDRARVYAAQEFLRAASRVEHLLPEEAREAE